ncbi:MAG: 30S ribosomal protein S15 [Nanoarchaeota archaeon]
MARMYSRKRGKSGSTKPVKQVKPSWLKYSAKEVEHLILKYHKEGKTQSQIGIFLRDEYGIPDAKVIMGKTIGKLLAERNAAPQIPEDIAALMRRSLVIRKHLETNKYDQPARRGLTLTDAKINRLAKYYKEKGVLAADWKYDPQTAKLLLN